MASYGGYIPVAQTPYLIQGMFSQKKFAALLASGVLNAEAIDAAIRKGDSITIPQTIEVDDFSSVDLTSTVAVTGTRANTNNAKAPIVRKYTAMSFTEHDDVRTGENWREKFAVTAGNKLAKDAIITMHSMLQGVINVSGLNHLFTKSGTFVAQDIRAAKKLLGDQGDMVDTMMMHSQVFSDFIYDLTVNYKYAGTLSGEWLQDGYIESVFGVKNIIISDDLTATAGASSDASGDQYYTWLFKRNDAASAEDGLGGPIYFGYQAEPRYAEFVDSRVPSTLFQPKWNTDYCIGVRGMTFNGPTNPLTTDLEQSSNWAQANNDSRNVGVVGIFSKGGVN
jgi:hypothetical protein